MIALAKNYRELFTFKLVSNDGWSIDIPNEEIDKGFEKFFFTVKKKMGLNYRLNKGDYYYDKSKKENLPEKG